MLKNESPSQNTRRYRSAKFNQLDIKIKLSLWMAGTLFFGDAHTHSHIFPRHHSRISVTLFVVCASLCGRYFMGYLPWLHYIVNFTVEKCDVQVTDRHTDWHLDIPISKLTIVTHTVIPMSLSASQWTAVNPSINWKRRWLSLGGSSQACQRPYWLRTSDFYGHCLTKTYTDLAPACGA